MNQINILHSALVEHGLYADIRNLIGIHQYSAIPSADTLNSLAANFSQFKQLGLTFVPQTENFDWQGQYYEEVINQRKIIPTRLNNWHDLFNACIWLLFPQTKRLLNQLHYADIQAQGLKKRTKRRDALTLFDECGIVFAISDLDWALKLREHQWTTCFWQQRADWDTSIRPFMFGHANYEMALEPYLGLTGKAFFIQVENDFFQQELKVQIPIIDQLLVEQILSRKQLEDNQNLSPMPFLGIPSWYQDNESLGFYQNIDYFRPKRIKK
ncbi:DUF3025 domain-containing protein [Saccharobesus litoralis]|uniref:DUF3025 domain-containing protein n=1 Tax=Saccharobesus litoralis TaxID=2172099 RepID=A0A2S0VTX6_9ALTE|nr:DUF3025 domain-containing protein [Saccharobesus litoralis]AWB67667.1 DUF3025 domain-containing protein [Saccharobesus litoralis]